MDFNYSEKSLDLQKKLNKFFEEHIYPIEQAYDQEIEDSGNSLHIPDILDELKNKAKEEGLWNLFLPDSEYGAGLTNVEYAPLAEITGKVWWAPEVFNCSAPDTGNMEVLYDFGTDEQKEEWLTPLLDGSIRSCFAMTEPDVASSDATNISSSIVSDGDNYIINGRKWWTSNAINPRAKICIFMGVTNPENAPHQRQSQILVPMDSEGISIIRPMQVYGYDDGYTGHPELLFENVVVPKKNIIGGEGLGFKIAQARLGPGRIHHCMRAIGMAERALELMIKRSLSREAFGKQLSDQGVIQEWIAKSRIKIEEARLLTLKTAWLIDTYSKEEAKIEISSIKVTVVEAASYVIDKAIQAHGAMGLSQDTPLARMAAGARVLRIADGPDEVHLRSIARREMNKYK
ncbi:acyl-CoA dehydrogenase family protein [Acidimicrobiia bacterium]|nr:acyl-CoA dehydrogenase family protein [Acidimicrobiia bacterium]MDA7850581.1 acyl-CoA dehydrogenase family protein [Acidimicrobiaceae bacterium]MDA8552712.1 acyl-CoA dehydrogenase family protein [bacterium]MDA8667412.1 acyl-CoA dehydrogenase family protein [Candidatus Actinomarina sp.]MDA7548195.1 acyl-CoA dehydrogenase family protein [Acidimicrobiia bacterium]